jgi:NAD(P)H-hydrate epimerase
MRLLTADEMRALDREAIDQWGLPGAVLMENAGRGVADQLEETFAELWPGPLLIVAGKGNNGGDGFVAARHLLNRGWDVSLLLLADLKAVTGDARLFLDLMQRSGADLHPADDGAAFLSAIAELPAPVLVVDALLGTGFTGALSAHYSEVIDWVNALGVPVLAVDVPSGTDATSGAVSGTAIQAELTVTFESAKVGHVVDPAADYVGDLTVVDIGIPQALSLQHAGCHHYVDAEAAAELLPERPLDGHKGTFGHLLVVAGSTGKTGAGILAATAGLRSGAGLVTLACPASLNTIFEVKLTEAMTAPLPDAGGELTGEALPELTLHCEGKQALCVGPGLGTGTPVSALIRGLLAGTDLPLILDADGLNVLAANGKLFRHRAIPAVLTPHPGEMARLLNVPVATVTADRLGIARKFAVEHGVVLVLKGAQTVVAAPDGNVYLNGSGNPLLASGGTGDVLAGLIGGLLAQGLDPVSAAVLGVFWHGFAADRLAESRGDAGLLASDLLRALPDARHALLHGDLE